jgi:hypothetical protein
MRLNMPGGTLTMPKNPDWTRDEHILALNLYVSAKPGQPQKGSREVFLIRSSWAASAASSVSAAIRLTPTRLCGEMVKLCLNRRDALELLVGRVHRTTFYP